MRTHRLLNLAKGDVALSLEIAKLMKTSELRAILPLVDDVLELKNVLAALGNDSLRLQKMLLYSKNVSEVSKIITVVGDAALAERLLIQVGEGNKLLGLLTKVPNAAKLEELLAVTPRLAELSDDALQGMMKMNQEELAALNGKTIAEIESAGLKTFNKIDFSQQLVIASDYIQQGKLIEGVSKIDLMGGASTSFGKEYVNIDIAAQTGIKGSSTDLSKILPPNSVKDIIVNNPFNPTIKNPFELFLNDSYIVLEQGGTIKINGQMQNPLFKKITVEGCEEAGFEVVLYRGALSNEFKSAEYFTTQGSKIDPTTMQSILLKKK